MGGGLQENGTIMWWVIPGTGNTVIRNFDKGRICENADGETCSGYTCNAQVLWIKPTRKIIYCVRVIQKRKVDIIRILRGVIMQKS